MLTSLIVVLLLLSIGGYALFLALTGRIGSEEVLSPPKRIVMTLAGLVALGIAFVVYSNPRALFASAEQAPKSWNAMPSNPPETRGSTIAEADAAAEAALANPAARTVTTDGAAPAAPATPAATAPTPVPAGDGDSDSEVSAAALAMEAELMRRRKGLPSLPGEPERPAVVAQAQTGAGMDADPAPAAAAPASAPSRSVAPTPARRESTARTDSGNRRSSGSATRSRRPIPPLEPLTIVIHNELGETQQRETLSLVIEGKRVASFEITDAAPIIALPIRLPRPGLIHYKLEGETVQGRRQTLSGQGCISATDGARFQVRRNPGSRRVFLESVSG